MELNKELTPEDNKTIEKIGELLTELKPLLYGLSHLISQDCYNPYAETIQPSPAKDVVEYVIFFKSEIPKYPKNSVWLWSDLVKAGFKNFAGTFFCYEYELNPSTLSAYQAQQQVEWKVGEWCWADKSKTTLGIITKIYSGKNTFADINTQTEKYSIITGLYIEEFTRPTKQEIFNHLRGIAEKKYPVGTKFKNAIDFCGKEIGIADGDYIYSKVYNGLYTTDKPNKPSQCIWYQGKWAEQVEDVKERYDVDVVEYGYSLLKGEYKVVVKVIEGEMGQTEANEIAQKIKNLLKN